MITQEKCDCAACKASEPDYETKLKILSFSKGMLKFKEQAEKMFDDGNGEIDFDKIKKHQDEELEKLFKQNFEEEERPLFQKLVTSSMMAFSHGKTINVEAIEEDLKNERANNLN